MHRRARLFVHLRLSCSRVSEFPSEVYAVPLLAPNQGRSLDVGVPRSTCRSRHPSPPHPYHWQTLMRRAVRHQDLIDRPCCCGGRDAGDGGEGLMWPWPPLWQITCVGQVDKESAPRGRHGKYVDRRTTAAASYIAGRAHSGADEIPDPLSPFCLFCSSAPPLAVLLLPVSQCVSAA